MSGAVSGAIDAGTKVAGISDEVEAKPAKLKSANPAAKSKSSVANKKAAANKKTKTGK